MTAPLRHRIAATLADLGVDGYQLARTTDAVVDAVAGWLDQRADAAWTSAANPHPDRRDPFLDSVRIARATTITDLAAAARDQLGTRP